jgi:hypothetical protein
MKDKMKICIADKLLSFLDGLMEEDENLMEEEDEDIFAEKPMGKKSKIKVTAMAKDKD